MQTECTDFVPFARNLAIYRLIKTLHIIVIVTEREQPTSYLLMPTSLYPEFGSLKLCSYFFALFYSEFPKILLHYAPKSIALFSRLFSKYISRQSIRDQPIMLSIMLCCFSLKIHLLCSITRIVVRLLRCLYAILHKQFTTCSRRFL